MILNELSQAVVAAGALAVWKRLKHHGIFLVL